MKSSHILITGGVRSGKSRHALDLALQRSGPRYFLATAQPFDTEMRERIAAHRAEREDRFFTVEEPLFLALALGAIPPEAGVVVIDCVTLWVNNLLYRFAENLPAMRREIDAFADQLQRVPFPVILVTNETGLGIMPDNALVRRFADELGGANQRLARLCDEVLLMVCGIPQVLQKGLPV